MRKNPATLPVLGDIARERRRQDDKWGVQYHSSFVWGAVLGEEVGEVHMACLEDEFGDSENVKVNLREELIQVAAVAVAWVEAIDRDAR